MKLSTLLLAVSLSMPCFAATLGTPLPTPKPGKGSMPTVGIVLPVAVVGAVATTYIVKHMRHKK